MNKGVEDGRSDANGKGDFEDAFWRTAPVAPEPLAPLASGAIDDADFRLLADSVPMLCWIANGDGYIVWYNRRWHDYCGTTPDQMEGWGWQSVHDSDRLPEVMERWTTSIATGAPFEMTFPLRGADGVFRPFLTRVSPVRDASGAVVRWCGVNTEVSAQVAAEDALRRERDSSRDVLEGMAEGFALLDRDFRFTTINAEGLRIDTRPADEIIGRVHWDVYPGSETGELGRLYKKAMAERVPVSLEIFYAWEDGREEWYETRAVPTVGGLALFYRNVSERKRAEDEAQAAGAQIDALAAQQSAILGQLAEGVIVTDTKGRIVFVNQAAERLHGVATLDIAPDDYSDTYHLLTEAGDPYPAHDLPLARAVEHGETVVDARWRIARPDGSEVIAIGSARPILDADGDQAGAVLTLRDDTERRRSEQALRESEARARLVLDSAAGGFYSVDREGVTTACSRGFLNMLGFASEADAVGRKLHDLIHHTHPDGSHYDVTDCPIYCAASSGVAAHVSDELFFRLDGTPIPVEYWATPIIRDGEHVGAVCTSLDITDRKAAETALQELNETLEARVEERTAELEQAQEALRQSQKMEAVGQLTGGIAHDFNNLLTVVIGNLDMGRRSLEAAGGDARTRRSLDNALKGAERAAALTQRLLAFARRQPLAPKPLDADKLVLGMADMLNRTLGETIKLEIVTSPGLWRIEADPNQLEAAILNLAVNARDAMPHGGKLTIATANASITEAYSAAHAEVVPGNYIVMTVGDSGEGMSKATLTRVFEPFFTTKAVGKGTGLGLSQVYGFVKQSGGHVTLYSEQGQGTTVKVYLPRLMGEGEVDEETPPAEIEMSAAEETLLVVEDDDDVRAYTVALLREIGYRVLEAHDGPSALRLIERVDSRIDLLFTDVVMPGMSGRELADAARAHQPDLKILYTSGYTKDAIVHGGRLDPGVDLVAKPFTYQILARKVRDMLETGRSGRTLMVDGDAARYAATAAALAGAGYVVDRSDTAGEALGRVRANGGRYDFVVIDTDLADRGAEALAGQLRALHCDMPILLVAGDDGDALRGRLGSDRCIDILGKPYAPEDLQQSLKRLGVRCAGTVGSGTEPA